MLPCRGRLSLASLMGSRFSSGLWVWPWVRGLAGLGLTSGPKCSVCISLSLSPFPLPQPLALSPSYVCLSLTLSSVPHLSMSGWGRGSWLVYLWVTLYFGLQVPHLWWGWGSPPPPPAAVFSESHSAPWDSRLPPASAARLSLSALRRSIWACSAGTLSQGALRSLSLCPGPALGRCGPAQWSRLPCPTGPS